ncbi:MAG: efflux RND transporter periplasmic adaptor subunit [Planctomycetota bacterium]
MSERTASGGLSRRHPCALLSLCLVLSNVLLATSCEDQAAGEGLASEADAGPRPPDAIAIDVTPISRESISSLYSTSETLRAEKQAVVIARTSGILETLLVEEGDAVEEGQPLAQLEDDEQRIAAEQAKTAWEIQKRELERIQKLHDNGILTDTDLADAKRLADERKNSAELADLTLSRTIIRAPFSGTIVERFLDVGATVSNGTSVYHLADLDPLYVDVRVPERQVARIAPGQSAVVTSETLESPITAKIERISPAVDPQTSTVKVTLAISGTRAGLRPGGFVRIAIVTDTIEDAWIVPRSALVAEGRRWQIFRLQEDESSVELLEVRPGYEQGESVQIAEVLSDAEPLAAGDRIVSLGASALKDGSPVQLPVTKKTEATPPDLANEGEAASDELTETPNDEG